MGIFAVYSGFYGMNFNRIWPPFSSEWGVFVVIAMMVGTTISVYLFLRWKGWLE
jgi:Mg2+ and Co2+ transporter CorA